MEGNGGTPWILLDSEPVLPAIEGMRMDLMLAAEGRTAQPAFCLLFHDSRRCADRSSRVMNLPPSEDLIPRGQEYLRMRIPQKTGSSDGYGHKVMIHGHPVTISMQISSWKSEIEILKRVSFDNIISSFTPCPNGQIFTAWIFLPFKSCFCPRSHQG